MSPEKKDKRAMYILLSSAEQASSVRLEEPDDCTRFHVALRGLSQERVQEILAREDLGRMDGREIAWIKIAWLRQHAQGRVQPDWSERFAAMLKYAERKGWLSDDKQSVSGHCEWS
jgi:hypothetical protein